MKFILNGTITFNKDAEEAQEDIAKFIEEANTGILKKGVKEDKEEEGCEINSWELKNDTLTLTLKSGHRVRAHDGILRIKKPLTELLGKKYHIGVRKIHADQYKILIPKTEDYQLNTDAATKLKDSSSHLTQFTTDDKNITLQMEDIDESSLRKQVVNRAIKQIINKEKTKTTDGEVSNELTNKVTKATPGEIIAKSPKFQTYPDGDVNERVVELGWVKKFSGRGQWFYGPPMVALQRALEKILVEEIVEKLGFQECLFPKLIPFSTMEKMRYFEGLPEGMYYCSAPKRDPELFDKFRSELVLNQEVPVDLLKQGLKDPSYVLAPAQCEPFYEFLSHEVVNRDDLPLKLYDKSGWTYRWEAGGAKGLDRVHEFQRIELVWLSTPEEVNNIRDQTLELSHELCNKLELEWYTEIGDDPFYLEGRKSESRNIEFPDVPKYEMRLKIPGQEKGVAVVSANVHGTHFVEGFSIKEAHRDRIWTGCTGLGLTRWLFGFLAQKGFDTNNWPKIVQEKLAKTYIPKVVTWPKK